MNPFDTREEKRDFRSLGWRTSRSKQDPPRIPSDALLEIGEDVELVVDLEANA